MRAQVPPGTGARDRGLVRREPPFDLGAHILDVPVEFADVAQHHAQGEPLMRAHPPLEGLLEGSPLGPHASAREGGKDARILLAPDQRPQDGQTRHAGHLGGDRGELDVRSFEDLLDPVDLRRPFPDERRAVAGQLAQLPLRARRDEAGPEQAVAEEVGDPLGVPDVGLASGRSLDVGRVDDEELEASSRMLCTGVQYEPVLSMATWASSSRVVVPKVRTARSACAPGPGMSRHATTVRLWTSSPAQRGWTTCMARLQTTTAGRALIRTESASRAPRRIEGDSR